VPRLFEALGLARGDGRYGRLLKTLGRVQVLILDYWGLAVLSPAERRDLLEILEKSRPLIDALEPWLRTKLGLISQKGKLAEAIKYALSRWEGLSRFLTIAASSSTTTPSSAPSAPFR
jgi:hypothetical protein